MKFLLLAILAVVIWYVVAPFFTPRPLRPGKGGRKRDDNVIEGKGKVID